jgi:outer membrane lipoprotein-sorting protein
MKAMLALLSTVIATTAIPQLPQSAPIFLEGAAVDEFLAEIEERMSSSTSVIAEFDQVQVLKVFEDRAEAKGAILFARPDRLRWEILEPFESVLIVAGDDAAKFESVSGERRALKLGRAKEALLVVMGQIRNWFQGRFEQRVGGYEMRVARKPVPMITLVPSDPKAAARMTTIEVYLVETLASVRQVILRKPNGDHTTMTFTERARDVTIPDAYFSVKNPARLELDKLVPAEAKAGQ